jgi:putative peptide zinc metalloprotease protein
MNSQRQLFSESWHRVASQRLRLRPSVRVRRQSFRGELWYVAQDTFTNAFYRFRPEAYAFLVRLDGTRTVDQIWNTLLKLSPAAAPGQGEIVAMLSQLYRANLLASDSPGDAAQLFERQRKFNRARVVSQLLGIFFLRIRLFDPNPLLNRSWPYLRWLGSRTMGLVWLAVVGTALAMVLGNWHRALDQSQAVLAPGNLPLLYVAFTVAKLVHEFGHAYAVRAFGGEVHAMGVTLLVFTPIPYVDATAAWAFRERYKRVLVGLGGMIPELFYAALAAFVWAGTAPGTLNSLAYNTMVVASVSTVIFNVNPLLRFDGYYILSDLLDSPNLQPRSQRQWLYLVERYLFGSRAMESPSRSRWEALWLACFGAGSWFYRLVVTVGIVLLVADRYFGLGLLAGIITLIGAFVVPALGAVRYLASEPRLERVRVRAWAWAAALSLTLVVLLAFVPFPEHFRAPGVVRAGGSMEIYNQSAGWVAEMPAGSRMAVAGGERLFRLENHELDLQLAAARADLDLARVRELQMLTELPAGIAPMRQRREAAAVKLSRLEAERAALEVQAPVAGEWVSPRAEQWRNSWLSKGARLGEVVGRGPQWEFFAVVGQEEASALFGAAREGAEIRFPGSAGTALPVALWKVVPGRQDVLPDPALGWAAGGPVKVKPDDPRGLRTDEPFFLVVGSVTPGAGAAGDGGKVGQLLWQGRTGVMRFAMPASPLLVRWARSFRQLVQQRYQI